VGLEIVPARASDDEGELIAACLRGDRSAERTLFRREYPRVNATIYRMLGQARETDDLVQETFIAVFRALPRFRRESKLATWIDRIAVRVVLHHISTATRKRNTVSLDVLPDVEDRGATVDHRAQAREGLRRLYDALAGMKPDARMAFALYAIDGRSVLEVAELMGCTRITAKTRIWRARREIERHAKSDPILANYLAAGGDALEPEPSSPQHPKARRGGDA
jgi:RNA polymerase sigma-70 factor, ECF subfamily